MPREKSSDYLASLPPSFLLEENDNGNDNNPDDISNIDWLHEGFGNRKWVVHKFGGTSVGDAACFLAVARILEHQLRLAESEQEEQQEQWNNDSNGDDTDGAGGGRSSSSLINMAVVVSAMGGKPKKTTDLLLEAVEFAARRDDAMVETNLGQVWMKHELCVEQLFPVGHDDEGTSSPSSVKRALLDAILQDLEEIRDILKTVSLMKWQAQRISEVVSGYGELWSTQILTALLQQRQLQEKKRQEERRQQQNSNNNSYQTGLDYSSSSAAINQQQQEGDEEEQSAAADDNDYRHHHDHDTDHHGDVARQQRNTRQEKLFDHKFVYVDARRVITIDEEAIYDGAVVWDTSESKFRDLYEEEQSKLVSSSSKKDEDEGGNENLESGENNTSTTITVLHFIVTGYVASNTNGVPVTLQRDGSDYTAAIMGRILRANSICIWTDVDGVLSADPRRVPLAQVLPEVSYDEAMELSYFGAKVIHPKTMQPAISCVPQIPIYIRNTFRPDGPGTRIFLTSTTTNKDSPDKVVCGFSSIERMALVNVEGSGLIGVPGIDARIFGSLQRAGVNVSLISQASSEHSCTFATTERQAAFAKHILEEEFTRELRQNRISRIDIRAPCSIIAAVGDGMAETTGVSGRFFSALGDAKINILAIAQGSSERNISAVVWSTESTRALRAVHAAFNLSHNTIRVGVIGVNSGSDVGDSLLQLLETQRTALRDNFDLDIQVCTVVPRDDIGKVLSLKNDTDSGTDSITIGAFHSAMARNDGGTGPKTAVFEDEESIAVCSPGGLSFVKDLLFRSECTSHAIFDCTNSEEVGRFHAEWLRAGIDVITANNTGLSGPKEQREDIKDAEKALGKQSAQYLREVVVAGGLPVINTLRSLLNSGDKIRRIDAILTVVKSYVMYRISPPPDVSRCSQFDEVFSNGAFTGDMTIPSSNCIGDACSFSQAIREAIELGLTEDDPWKDLNNEYAARVLMTLARELGMDEENETERIQDASHSIADFFGFDGKVDFNNLPLELDQRIQERVDEAKSRGCVLRSIASIDVLKKEIDIKIVEVPDHHTFAVSPPGNSCVRFFTKRHMSYPLVIQGPSAGADSTASALLAELIQRTRGITSPRSLALRRESSGAFLRISGKSQTQLHK